MLLGLNRALHVGQPVNPSAPLNRDLVGWWMVHRQPPFNIGGARFLDLCGKNHASFVGSTWAGSLGRPGGTGALACPINTYALTASGSEATRVSYSCWTRWRIAGSANYPRAMGTVENGALGTTDRYFQFAATEISFRIFDGATKSATYTSGANNDIWWHLVGTADGSNVRLYVNGVLQATTAAGNPFTGYSDPRLLLGSSVDSTAHVDIDDVRFAERVWSDNEVASLYQASLTGYQQELNYYRRAYIFDVGAGGGGGAGHPAVKRMGGVAFAHGGYQPSTGRMGW
jgi:hypothetical protein